MNTETSSLTAEAAQSPSYAKQLRERMWKTAGARFNAHRRLSAQHSWSLWTIAWLSVVVIAVSVSGLDTLNEGAGDRSRTATLVVICSVSILALSLLEAGRNALLQADRLHSCAMDINRLVGKLGAILDLNELDSDTVDKVREDYEAIIARYAINHKPIDHRRFIAQHWQDLGGNRQTAIAYRAEWVLVVYGPYAVAIIAGLVFAVALIW